MKIVINTQYKENYGAHDWDGTGECPQYWKFKGGSTYVVSGVDVMSAMKDQEKIVNQLQDLICYEDDGSMVYILDWNIMDEGQSVCEEWETPIQCHYINGKWTAMVQTDNRNMGWRRAEILQIEETYDMVAGGDRDNYKAEYLMEDGDLVIGAAGLTEWLATSKIAV